MPGNRKERYMNLGGLTREMRLLGAAGANALFIIFLFLDWGGGLSAKSILDSWWLLLVIALVAGAVFAAEARNFALPPVLNISLATYLSSLTLFYCVIFLFDLPDHDFGFFLALLASIVGTGLAVTLWREER
ncbi:MAG: hypothetical protein AB1416_13175 [Actinomycetota bacterium]